MTLNFKKVGKILGIIAALFVGFFLFADMRTPQELFEVLIAKPIPQSVVNIKREGSLNAFGSSSLGISFQISPADFESMMNSMKFKFVKHDAKNPQGRKPNYYLRVVKESEEFIHEPFEIFVYEHSNSVYRFDAIVVNKEHTAAYYRAF
jgi:hypothetical protein